MRLSHKVFGGFSGGIRPVAAATAVCAVVLSSVSILKDSNGTVVDALADAATGVGFEGCVAVDTAAEKHKVFLVTNEGDFIHKERWNANDDECFTAGRHNGREDRIDSAVSTDLKLGVGEYNFENAPEVLAAFMEKVAQIHLGEPAPIVSLDDGTTIYNDGSTVLPDGTVETVVESWTIEDAVKSPYADKYNSSADDVVKVTSPEADGPKFGWEDQQDALGRTYPSLDLK